MIALLPPPIKGELFFGTLCRLYARMGRPARSSFAKVVMGYTTANPGTTIPRQLEAIGSRLPPGYPVNADGIRAIHSLEPFLLGFVSWAKKQKYTTDTHLKSCPECRANDLSMFGDALWRTIHQAGNYCITHECPLEIAEKPSVHTVSARSYVPDYFLPNEVKFQPINPIGQRDIHIMFLRAVQEILDGKNIPWKREMSSLWGEMERQGYTRGLQVDGWKVLKKGKEKFGAEMETLFGITDGGRGRRVITNVLTEYDPSPHRILFLHLLLDLPVWQEAAPAKRVPRDYRETRNNRERVPKEKHRTRKAFLTLIAGKLPSDFRNRAIYKKIQADDPIWLAREQEVREKMWGEVADRLKRDDPIAAAFVREAAASLRRKEGCPDWIRKTTILRASGENRSLIQRCSHSPLTEKALCESVETQEEVIQRRIEWAKAHAPKTLAEYEFRAFARVRGIKKRPKIPGVLNRQAKKELRDDQIQTMRRSLDPEAAAIVAATVKRMNAHKERPVWITLTGIVREAGKEGEIVEACRSEHLTGAAIAAVLDTPETICIKRVAWAREYRPEILRLSPYEQKYALGLRTRKKT